MTKSNIAALAAIMVVSSLGCAPGKATIKSVKRDGYDQKLEKTLMVVEYPWLPKPFMDGFRESLVKELRLRGVEPKFAKLSEALAVDDGPTFKQQAAEIGAGSLFAILPDGGTTYRGTVSLAKFEAQIYDTKMEKRVWRAQVEWRPGTGQWPVDYQTDLLTYEVIMALVSDGMIRGPLPARPEPPPPPKAAPTNY